MSACIPIRHFRFICLCTHHIFPYLKSFFLSYSLSPSVSLFHSLALTLSVSLCLLIGIVNVGNFKHLRSMWSTYIYLHLHAFDPIHLSCITNSERIWNIVVWSACHSYHYRVLLTIYVWLSCTLCQLESLFYFHWKLFGNFHISYT